MIYQSPDMRFALCFGDEHTGQLVEAIKKAGDLETGGIIIGRYTPDFMTAEVLEFTPPPKDSRAGRTWFIRGNHGLKNKLATLWKEGYYYLGEWHFHPDALPTPSGQDLLQMKTIAAAANYQCPEPMLLIIGGSEHEFSVRIFVFPQKGRQQYELARNKRS